MKRSDYENYTWYPIVDEGEYWVEDYPEEFPGCKTILTDGEYLYTRGTSFLGWGTMAKYGGWWFMIIEIKKLD